jgi:hypothetical protein
MARWSSSAGALSSTGNATAVEEAGAVSFFA